MMLTSALRRCIISVFAFACVVSTAVGADAHPADEIRERDLIQVNADSIDVNLTISAGAITLLTVWRAADTNGDGELDEGELMAFGETLARGIVVDMDGTTIPVRYVSGSLHMATTRREFSLQGADASGATVGAAFILPSDLSRPHDITINVNHFRANDGAQTPEILPTAGDPIAVIVQGSDNSGLRMTVATQGAASSPPSIGPAPGPNSHNLTMMQRFVRRSGSGPSYVLLGFIIAAALGALHALTPGHGKTLITAYLIGADARPRDALALGGVITATHTSSVVALGVLTLVTAHIWTPYRLLPWIELASSAGIVALGGWLVWARFTTVVAQPRRPSRVRTATVGGPSGADVVLHEHGDGTLHTHRWFGSHTHERASSDTSPMRVIALVGISGGILPCPDALAILLIAVAAGRIVAGLLIVLAFSTGLAVVLTGIGLLVTSTRIAQRLPQRIVDGNGLGRWIPTFSAIIMVLVGAVSLARATVLIR